jgi:hypothetical protein
MDGYGMSAVSSLSNGNVTVWNLTPLPEERLCAVARALRSPSGPEKKALKQLPPFVYNVVARSKTISYDFFQKVQPIMGFPSIIPTYLDIAYYHSVAQKLDAYVGRNFLPEMAAIIDTFPLQASPSVEARVANLPECIQQQVYEKIVSQKRSAGELPEDRPPHYGRLAFHNRRGCTSTPEERSAALLAVWNDLKA